MSETRPRMNDRIDELESRVRVLEGLNAKLCCAIQELSPPIPAPAPEHPWVARTVEKVEAMPGWENEKPDAAATYSFMMPQGPGRGAWISRADAIAALRSMPAPEADGGLTREDANAQVERLTELLRDVVISSREHQSERYPYLVCTVQRGWFERVEAATTYVPLAKQPGGKA